MYMRQQTLRRISDNTLWLFKAYEYIPGATLAKLCDESGKEYSLPLNQFTHITDEFGTSIIGNNITNK